MQYKSTRDPSLSLSASQVIAQGISAEGGLFVPETLPDLTPELPELSQLSYRELAKRIFSYFLTDFTEEEIASCVDAAYTPEKFGGEEPVALVPLKDGVSLLELWHGPTCAFKDMALQLLPHLLTTSLKKAWPGKEAVILTATSGDTGKAALEGFQDVPGTRILVFYPQNGVSPMQKRQMVTQEGENVSVCAVEGNFDDAQTAVKRIFTDPAMQAALEKKGLMFSSANSINWGRLLPQVVYYFWAFFRLCREGKTGLEGPVNIAVPTGNFGNILAAFYAGRMGLPVKKYICASNRNNVLTDFIRTGVYDRRRDFYTTLSPSMDILVSSNLERLLFTLSGGDGGLVSQWMKELSQTGAYQVSGEAREAVRSLFYGGFCDDGGTSRTIRETFRREGYLCDPHTAVAVDVCRQYREETGDRAPVLIASTASPYKFTGSVLSALDETVPQDEFDAISRLEELSHTQSPKQLRALRRKEARFSDCVPKDLAGEYILRRLGIAGVS